MEILHYINQEHAKTLDGSDESEQFKLWMNQVSLGDMPHKTSGGGWAWLGYQRKSASFLD